MSSGSLGEAVNGGQVGVDHSPPLLVVHLRHRHQGLVGGVVHQDVEFPERDYGRLNHPFGPVGLTQVGCHLRNRSGQRFNQRSQVGGASVRQHRRSGLGESPCDPLADPSSRPGDGHHQAGEIEHGGRGG